MGKVLPGVHLFRQTPSATGIPLELLVRFLWANKENEQDTTRTRLGVKIYVPE